MTPEEIDTVARALDRPVMRTRTLAGGFSHETCLVDLADGHAVARMAAGADPSVEAAVMDVARAHGVPVPHVRHVCAAPEPRVRPFMIVEYVAATPLSDVLSGGHLTDTAEAGALGVEVGRVAASIGDVAFLARGFFVDRHLTVRAMPPWSQQLADFAETCMGTTPDARLDPATRRAWVELCAAHAPSLQEVDHETRLVHSDLNPKNILVTRAEGTPRVDAVLDWEFSYSGCPLGDVGNMTRHASDYPAGFLEGFRVGFAGHQEPDRHLPEHWVYLGHVLDMFALSDLVTRPLEHPIADQAAGEIHRWVHHGVPGTP